MNKKQLPQIEIEGKSYYLYFAYGSNLNKKQMSRRCPTSIALEQADLPHYHLLFRGNTRGFGVATVERAKGFVVPGALWAISESDLLILDKYEGYPTLYTRGTIHVKTNDKCTVEATTYWMHPHYDKALPSRDYLTIIYEGYSNFRIPTKKLERFYHHHIVKMEEETEKLLTHKAFIKRTL